VERGVLITVGILSLALAATGLTEATMALNHQRDLANDQAVRPATTVTPKPTATPAPTVTANPITTPAPTPVPAATLAPTAGTATTVSFVRLRAGASTNTAVLAELDGGVTMKLGTYRDSQWQQVFYNGQTGYIYLSYLRYN
jgi:hypothetical protein